jgi:hypothetical protein
VNLKLRPWPGPTAVVTGNHWQARWLLKVKHHAIRRPQIRGHETHSRQVGSLGYLRGIDGLESSHPRADRADAAGSLSDSEPPSSNLKRAAPENARHHD